MAKLYYCTECRRIEKNDSKCGFCESQQIKPLNIGAPVNVIGTKQKGRVFKINDDAVKLIVVNEAKEKLIKDYKHDEIQKIL
ncbi:hypothetical protein FQB35_12105 [Crassaminicella thermophila]|uniref:Uncharacterized protein n=1 Tax=Crassaminicella thermophila TaxID=2599308 RepID=A0A5C0SEY3_CRATE|nr:hypothetical protein [Crassaminicella thermophila]QEK13003.1 hypothetical protein FQB35_12105 [Crassaminicella thermophila]